MLDAGDIDGIEMSLDMNEELADIQMNQPWCNECQVLKQSLEDLRAACNQKATIISDLKEKIIPTDQLITDFYAKQEENQMLTKSLETCRRHCDELDQQLHSALARLEPLREANGKFERHIQRCEQDIEKLKAENEAYKICQQQSNLAHSTLLEKVRKLEEEKKEGQASYRRSESRLKKLQEEMVARKKEHSSMKKENVALENEVKSLTTKLAKFTNTDGPLKRNHNVKKVSAVYDHEMSSLLTSSILQMLPPMLSPMPSSDADLSEAEASDNDPSINHFASQLEAKLGCSDDNFPLPDECNDDVHAGIDEDNNDDEESGDEETDFVAVDEVNLSTKNSRELLTKSHLESQMSTGFDAAKDDDDRTPHVSRDGPKHSVFASSLASVPSTLEFVPSNPLEQKITTEVEVSGGVGHSAAKHRLLSSSSDDMACDDETSSASVLPLDNDNKSQGLLSATQPLSCPVSDNQSLSTSSPLVVSASSTSAVSTSSVSVSSIAVTCPADSSTSLYSLQSISSSCLSSAIPVSMPVCTTEASAAPIMSSEVTASSSFPGMYSTGANLSSPIACCASENALPPASSCTVPTFNQNSSAVLPLAASEDVHLTSACLPVGASDVQSNLTSHEIPVILPCVSATSSQLSNSVSVSSPCVTVITQCASAVILDSVLQASSGVSGVNSRTSEVVLPSSDDVITLTSKTVPLCSPCVTVAASSISRSALPCVSAVTSTTLNTSSSSVSVVTCNSVPLCSSGVTAKASSTTRNTSLPSCVSVAASATCNSVLASSLCVTLSNSTMSDNASLSSQCVSVSLPTSMSFSCGANRSASGSTPLESLSSSLFKSAVLPSNPEASLNHTLLRSQISLEEIFSYINISAPLSPLQSPRKSGRVQRKPLLESPQPTENLHLPSQIYSPPVTGFIEMEEDEREPPPTASFINHLLTEIDSGGQAVNQQTSILGFCPVPIKVQRMNSSTMDVHRTRGESNSTGRVQSFFPQSDSVFREKAIKTNAVNQRTLPDVSNPAAVLPTVQKSNCSELIDSIIKELLASTEDVIPMWFDRCTSGQTPAAEPWLTPFQHKLLSYIYKLADVTVLHEFCQRAVQVMSYKSDRIIRNGNTALCCTFVSICRYLGDVERVRVFVFDAVKCEFYGYASLITAVAAIWPLPLHVNSCSSEFAPVLYVLQHAIFARSLDASKPKHVKMKVCLEQLCGWRLPLKTGDEIARHLLTHLEGALNQSSALSQELAWNVELAFDLLCVTDGWQWSNNFVVVQLLWPILASWSANPADVKNQAFIEAVIGILGLVMSHCPATRRSNTDHILHVLLKLLREPTVAVSIQISVLRALLLLAKYQPDVCATMCLQWVKDHKDDLDTITKAMLHDFHKQFSSRLKYLSELVID